MLRSLGDKKRNTKKQALLISGQSFDNTLFLPVLMKYNVYTTEFTHCKCTAQWSLVHE